jgi:hypothetical protein
MSNVLTSCPIEAAVCSFEFRRAVVLAANRALKITEPQWDLVDHKIVYQGPDIITGKRKVAVTLIFEDNGLELR